MQMAHNVLRLGLLWDSAHNLLQAFPAQKSTNLGLTNRLHLQMVVCMFRPNMPF